METTTFDLAPAAEEVRRLVGGVPDPLLCDPTPCAAISVAGLLDHLVGLTTAFRMAAEKTVPGGGPRADAANLAADWRTRLPAQLDGLVDAWREPGAWDGTAQAGGVQMPAPVMAVVALDELVVHGWDLAVATGQEFVPDDAALAVVAAFTASMAEPGQEESRAGLFGPVVPVPADAPAFHRALGDAGRDPHWTPARAA